MLSFYVLSVFSEKEGRLGKFFFLHQGLYFSFQERMHVFLNGKEKMVDDEHVPVFSDNQFPPCVRAAIISSCSMEGKWHTAETFPPLRERSHFSNFCIMLTEKRMYVCARALSRSRVYKFLREHTCVRDVKGPQSLERAFQSSC